MGRPILVLGVCAALLGCGDDGAGEATAADTADAAECAGDTCEPAPDEQSLCEATGGTWLYGSCQCPGSARWVGGTGCEDRTNPQRELCKSTSGLWDEASAACDCGLAMVWQPGAGCAPLAPTGDEKLCKDTGGMWDEESAACQCAGSRTFTPGKGCEAGPTVDDCLASCDDACYAPKHELCGVDGEWWCPCELVCHGVEEAADKLSCCGAVPPGCVPTCEENVAKNCSSGSDGHGCPVPSWEEEPCDDGAKCVADLAKNIAYCEQTSKKELCESTGGDYSPGNGVCSCGEGGVFDEVKGCYGNDEQLCAFTGGTWVAGDCGPFCGTCTCPEEKPWKASYGCVSPDIDECLAACALVDCFLPEHMVCGVDGKWWCPCELACHEVEEDESQSACKEQPS